VVVSAPPHCISASSYICISYSRDCRGWRLYRDDIDPWTGMDRAQEWADNLENLQRIERGDPSTLHPFIQDDWEWTPIYFSPAWDVLNFSAYLRPFVQRLQSPPKLTSKTQAQLSRIRRFETYSTDWLCRCCSPPNSDCLIERENFGRFSRELKSLFSWTWVQAEYPFDKTSKAQRALDTFAGILFSMSS
jgi:hypothetical protein